MPTAWLCDIAFVQLLCRIRVPEFDPVRSNSVCVAALFSDCCAWCGHSFVRMRPSHVRVVALVFAAVRLRCPTATLRLGLGCAANYAGYIKATVRLLSS